MDKTWIKHGIGDQEKEVGKKTEKEEIRKINYRTT